MQPALEIGNATVWLGECREVMKALPPESVQCVVTSPPYFGLRDYGTAQWEGGDPACDHARPATTSASAASSTLQSNKKSPEKSAGTLAVLNHQQETRYRHTCGKCGATRQDRQIGLEATPEEYVASLVDVFREVKRILRKDGVVWLNLGDSFSTAPVGRFNGGSDILKGRDLSGHAFKSGVDKSKLPGLKPKDLIGIPWRVAFALQADGWYLRSEIIWQKPNGMPESVEDRPTRNHEQVFLLTKSPRYFYDKEAIAEPTVKGAAGSKFHAGFAGVNGGERVSTKERAESDTRNARSVWTIVPAGYKGAHFATMPEELARRCILAGSRVGDVVCDPFAGAGTTLKVAIVHNRVAWGCELNPKYIDLIAGRLDGVAVKLL
jgi:DNA modification methylase